MQKITANAMKQLVLDLGADQAHSLDTFEVGQNAELAHADAPIRRPHVARALRLPVGRTGGRQDPPAASAGRHPASRYIPVFDRRSPSSSIRRKSPVPARRLRPAVAEAQIDAFALFNQIREHGAFMVCTGAVPPAVLPVREDLRTRMGWGLIYQIHGLSDEEKSPR
jgi:DnaA family protein